VGGKQVGAMNVAVVAMTTPEQHEQQKDVA
jgi:hypothetical protein